jgi:hypothetical protein
MPPPPISKVLPDKSTILVTGSKIRLPDEVTCVFTPEISIELVETPSVKSILLST